MNNHLFLILFFLSSCSQNKENSPVLSKKLKNKIAHSFQILPGYSDVSKITDTFSLISINEVPLYVSARMNAFSEYLNKDFNLIDSVFTFDIRDTLNLRSPLSVEVWCKLGNLNSSEIIKQLEKIPNTTLYYKPPQCWSWFVHREKVFFLNYLASVYCEDLPPFKNKLINDTLFLDNVLKRLNLSKLKTK